MIFVGVEFIFVLICVKRSLRSCSVPLCLLTVLDYTKTCYFKIQSEEKGRDQHFARHKVCLNTATLTAYIEMEVKERKRKTSKHQKKNKPFCDTY